MFSMQEPYILFFSAQSSQYDQYDNTFFYLNILYQHTGPKTPKPQKIIFKIMIETFTILYLHIFST